MSNKKIWIVILLAAVLALAAAYFIFSNSNNKTQNILPEEETEMPKAENKTDAATEELQEEHAKTQIKTENVKQSELPAARKVSKPTAAMSVTKSSKNKPVQSSEIPSQQKVEDEMSNTDTSEIEKGVVVPVKYSSQSTYKYVYTPRRYTKK